MTVHQTNVASVPLIPRKILFDNPKQTAVKVSPDGSFLAYLAPSDQNVLNVWVYPRGSELKRIMTRDTQRGIRFFQWSEDSRSILYLQDKDGDENFHLWAVDITEEGSPSIDLTPFENVKVEGLMSSPKRPNELLIGMNQRDSSCFDVHRIFLDSREICFDTENPGDVVSWTLDESTMTILGATATHPEDGSTILRIRDSPEVPWRELKYFPYGEEGDIVDFSADHEHVYLRSSLEADKTQLVLAKRSNGAIVQTLAFSHQANVGRVLLHPDDKRLQAVSFTFARKEWNFFDESMKEDFLFIEQKFGDVDLDFTSRDHADSIWVLSVIRDSRSVQYIMFDRRSRTITPLFHERPELDEYILSKMESIIVSARDGMQLQCYLTRPVYGTAPFPLVLFVHGGPWARDYWGFNPMSQWFSNRGYACLQVNYRGSAGFGKSYLNAGDKQWGIGNMQNDLTDAVKWAIENNITVWNQVAIYGGSYGGYATLAGLVFTPELYCCGVDIVGPSNLKTLIDSVPDYWKPMKKELLLRIGPVDTDEEFNRKISPLFHVENIKAPLLIGQGANDPRVKQRESDQIVKAMLERNIPVEYVLYPDEGHGFARPPNRLDFLGRAEIFLSKYIGGRCEPYEKVAESTACLPIQEGLLK
ncbi:acylamino-acid-releasing enzyme isoform 1 [Galdieria sulphuraria]|uniref:Acylamino-acid-releasing enzyme isoform 1 n=1 Tax=Galdieria sulphuraria TaxID=130081 RepID=M2X6H7_GALSU|nr:acylamino-acid-releasing enzyme isoform 2 [Galdieria sulphuraria]XP_005708641.1 acylamino-acid-releasing enzyme isoform 1 [Galdieria sulphuraria]EME32120.1 acylamino-acid-releasing enzyme isoform 2 [Galdieria sulphuraria]EME32121.1 acylamino-acid-releasing enzyme isoform 1 [Galdieria sulphuraria]|eukprot:XP_005708640.1 acylamino-acid-releasing enzyme isoform 2 [Galdieria sulphuraria]